MKTKNNKDKIDEGWFRNWMDSQTGGEYSRLKGEDPTEIKNPKIIQEIVRVGVEDYIKRIRAEGIEINNNSSVAANIDRIKESVIEYVQAYMTSREENEIRNEILVKLKPILDAFERLSTVNLVSLKELFKDSALARADAIIAQKTGLKPSNKPPAITSMASLLANIPENKQLYFKTRYKNTVGSDVWTFLRKDGVYFLNLPKSIEDEIARGLMNTPPTVRISAGNNLYDVYPVKSTSNLQAVYNEFVAWYTSSGYAMPINITSLLAPVDYSL